MKYTPEQQKAIVTVDKDLAVTAGAGAGKTRVLVDRIIYILKNGLADIDEIVAITYTNKAALEIRKGFERKCSSKRRQLILQNAEKTRDCVSARFTALPQALKENPVEAGIDSDASILEEYGQMRKRKHRGKGP